MKRRLDDFLWMLSWSGTLVSGLLFMLGGWILQEVALDRAALPRGDQILAALAALVGGVALIVVRLATHAVQIHLIQPLNQLEHALNALLKGSASSKATYRGAVLEIARLVEVSNRLSDSLRQHTETLLRENARSRGAYQTMLTALEDTAAMAEARRESEQRYRLLAEAMPQIVWTALPDGTVDYFNRRWSEYTGLSPGEPQKQGWLPVLHPDDRDACLRSWKQALASHLPFDTEARLRRKDGSSRRHLIRATPVLDEHGHVTRWIGTATDIEDRRRAAELEARNAELQEIDQLKDQFLSVVSHELRTPINAITGFGSILDDELPGPLNEQQHRYLQKMLAGADSLLALVNDLLDMSRIQAGKFQLAPTTTHFPDVVEEALSSLRPLAERKQHQLSNEVPHDLPELVADPQRVGQVLINLLGNAIKFTPPGGCITIRACLQEDPGRTTPWLRCEVRDTGPGIRAEDQDKLFKQFAQLDMSSTRKAGGSGLGLSISKALVEAHGGEIGVDSEPNHGSTFWFTLPLTLPAPSLPLA